MLSFFKSDKRKTTRGLSYYDRENIVHNIKDLENVLDPVGKKEYTRQETIKYSGMALEDITENKIINLFAEADFIIEDFESMQNYKVLFYRHPVGKYTFVMQFHFYRGSFFFLTNMVSVAGVLTSLDKKTIIEKITKKNFPGLDLDLSKSNEIKVSDANNCFISVEDGVHFRVSYVNNSLKNQELLNKSDFVAPQPEEDYDSMIDDLL